MAYADKQAMEARFKALELVELTNPDDLSAETVNEAALTVALDDASAEIDAILSSRYSLPLANPPAILVALACDIARYRLHAGAASEEVETRYKNATKLLDRIAKGEVDLGAGDPGPKGRPAFHKPPTIFGPEVLR